ncbi:hypothetical protein F3Y22_tig00002840pilonHSYRG01136 [Hibiscus syriacus]|uniref:LRR receptor-like serine/threonine-protein kinase n=1 Tax=Hibiscus syriacus TaxID=106335 RepID=A0A6A3CQB1_HIBSY|nr:hypothetical protein F3Y22_tig00002840pilonHSYRG01136 [Hibiscus syriacus]
MEAQEVHFSLLVSCNLVLNPYAVAQKVGISSPIERRAMLDLRASLGLRGKDWPSRPTLARRGSVSNVESLRIEHHCFRFKKNQSWTAHPRFSVDPLVHLTRLVSFNASGFPLPGSIRIGSETGWLSRGSDLRSCNLSGSIPGSIPPSLGSLKGLQVFNLSDNNLAVQFLVSLVTFPGHLPIDLFSSLVELQVVDLSKNKLDGDLSGAIWSMPKLQSFDVSSNNFTGKGVNGIESMLVSTRMPSGCETKEFGGLYRNSSGSADVDPVPEGDGPQFPKDPTNVAGSGDPFHTSTDLSRSWGAAWNMKLTNFWLKIATGAAEGLFHLHHECNPSLVHRDVQASSILLDDKFEVRLGSLSEVRVRRRYTPNVLRRLLRKSQTSEPAASGSDEDLLEEVWAMAIVARSCLNPKPSKRPLMKHVLKALENPLKVSTSESATIPGHQNREGFSGFWQSGFSLSEHPLSFKAIRREATSQKAIQSDASLVELSHEEEIESPDCIQQDSFVYSKLKKLVCSQLLQQA